jgi:putative peptidoglycan lipid II flippase
MNRAAEFALALTLPAAVALAVIPGPIVTTLFERGAFSEADAAATALAVALFALGLPAFVLQKVVQPAFFAREDMTTPLRCAAWSMGVNTAISVAGAPLVGWAAIPVGTTVGGWVHLWLLWRGARIHGADVAADDRLRARAPLLLAASALCGLAAWSAAQALAGWLADPLLRWPALGLTVGAGAGVYAIAAWAFGAVSAADLRGAFRRGGAPREKG